MLVWKYSLLYACIFACLGSIALSQLPDRNERLANERLPGDLWPDHYVIEIQPYVYNASELYYDGNATIYMTCRRATTEVIVNVWDFEPNNGSVVFQRAPGSSAPSEPSWTRYEVNHTVHFFTLYLESPLFEGATYMLQMTYRNQLNDFGRGMYYASYEIDGQTRYLAATQFQTIYARQAFPNFDEPEYKATFDVILVRRSHYRSLSNMPIIRQEPRADDWVADVYNTSVRMSSYLLCMVVCDFEFVETTSPNGHLTRIWARPNAMSLTDFALPTAARIMDFMEDYTYVGYPLPKMDHIAIPAAIPAMEHWGLITYSEMILLYNATSETTARKQTGAFVIAHELAHQWFGNLVTCTWWDHTWVNEGMTSFFNYLPLEDVLQWPAGQLQAVAQTRGVMAVDGYVNITQPIVVPVRRPRDAGTGFHTVTYNKGAALMRMFKNVMTVPTFRRALQRYLERHQYGNAQTEDVWRAFQEQVDEDGITEPDDSPLNVTEKFDPWMRQLGYPLLHINREDLDLLDDEAIITVSHYQDPPDQPVPPSPYGYQWNVPLTMYDADDIEEESTETRHWLDRVTEERVEGFPSPLLWGVVNVNWGAYYRVEYDDIARAAQLAQLEIDHEDIPLINRAFLIENEFEVARSQERVMTDAMDFTRFLENEVEFAPWEVANSQLENIIRMLIRSNVSEALGRYMRLITDSVYETEGGGDWTDLNPDMEHTRLRLREIIVTLACDFNNPNCEQNATDVFQRWFDDPANVRIHPDVQVGVWCTSIRLRGTEEWDFLYQQYQGATVAGEALRYEGSLACSEERGILERYFERVLNRRVPVTAATFMVRNPIGEEIVWTHLRNAWNTSPLDRMEQLLLLGELADGFNTEEDRQQLQAHINQHPADDEITAEGYEDAMATTNRNIAWMARNREPLRDWLETEAPSDDSDDNYGGWGYSIMRHYQKTEMEILNKMF